MIVSEGNSVKSSKPNKNRSTYVSVAGFIQVLYELKYLIAQKRGVDGGGRGGEQYA